MVKIVKHTFLLVTAAILMCACDYNSFPASPGEEVYRYDTVFIPGLPVPIISVRTAVAIGQRLADQQETQETYYIAGIVKSFDKKHEEGMTGSYHNAVFYICDHMSSGVTFEGYQVMSINKAKFASLEQIQIGDTVIICSKITRYKKTIETPGKSVAYLYWTSNMLAYPEKPVTYVEADFTDGLGAWAPQNMVNPGFEVWKQNVSKSGTAGIVALGKDADKKLKASEVWIISPAFNLAANRPVNPTLRFQTYFFRENGDDSTVNPQDMFRLKISANDGKDWTDIAIPHFNSGKLRSAVNDTIDISAYVSTNTRVAFAYKSTETFAPEWGINTIKIEDNKRSR
ncbi:MAG: choice-of-anchor J domain-containing protein [Paludibacteraceae bacterium]|nr:choice-of-anchor J domain-containing protein [Paludibacteraceae bacterium]